MDLLPPLLQLLRPLQTPSSVVDEPAAATGITGAVEPEPSAQLILSLDPVLRQLDVADRDLLPCANISDRMHRQCAKRLIERAIGIRNAAVGDARVVLADDELGLSAAGVELDAVAARDDEETGRLFDLGRDVFVAAAGDDGVEFVVAGFEGEEGGLCGACEGVDGVDEGIIVKDAVESEEGHFGEDARAEPDGLSGEDGEAAAFWVFGVAFAVLVEDLVLGHLGQPGCLWVIERYDSLHDEWQSDGELVFG